MASPLRSPFRNIANCVVKVLNWSQGKEESEVESNNEQASKSRSVSPEIPKLEEPVKYIMNDENTSTESRQSRSSKKATPKPEVKVATPRSRTKTSAPNSEIRRSRRKLPFEEEQSMSPNQSHDLDVGQRKSRRKLSLQNYDKGESSSKTNTPSKRSTQAKSQTPKKELTPRKSSRRSAVKLDKVDDSEIPKKSPQKKIASDMKMVLKKNKDTSNEWTAITPTKAKISEEDETDKAVKARRTSRRNTPCKRIDSPKKETPVKDSRVQRPSRASKQFPKLKDDEDEDWTLKTKDQESDSEDDFVIKTRSPSKRFTPRKTQTPKKDFTPRKSTRAAAVKQEDEEVPTAPKNLLKTPKRRNCSIEARAHRDTPAKRRKTMTPRIPARSVPLAKDKSSLAEAQLRLHVGAVPDSLPCREDEFAQVLSFTEGKIFDGTGGCMYISGVPGTGKTATVKEVIRTLQSYTDMGDLPAFDFIEINGMRLTEPNQAYSQLWKALTGAKVTTEHAKNLLEKRFTTANAQNSRKQKTSVVLVDELDLLWNRKQSVLYNIFEWPNNKFSKLVILAIANTMDLPVSLTLFRRFPLSKFLLFSDLGTGNDQPCVIQNWSHKIDVFSLHPPTASRNSVFKTEWFVYL